MNLPNIRKPSDGFRTQDLSIERRLTLSSNPTHSATAPPPPPHQQCDRHHHDRGYIILLIDIVKMLMNYCLHRPIVEHTSPAGVYHHLIFTYFRVLQVKLSCRLAVSRAQDEWRASNALQDIKYYRLYVTVYICGDL